MAGWHVDIPLIAQVLVTDGITSVMSDQEIVDFVSTREMLAEKGGKFTLYLQVKQHKDPSMSAKKLVDAADQLQSDDNTTAVVSTMLV